jgi:zinc protease
VTQMIDRTQPPATPPIPAFKMPPVHQTTLPNGLVIVLVEDARFPLVSMRLSFQAGSKFDRLDLPGLSGMVAGLVTQGTATRSYRDLAEELTSIGARLSGHASPDVFTLGGSVLSENTAKLLDLLADVALNANFPENEVQLRKQNAMQTLAAQRSQPAFLANEKFDALVFGSHPYSFFSATMESLERMDRKSIVQFRDAFLVPNHAVLLLVGQLPPQAETLKLVQDRFASWKEKPVPAAPEKSFPTSKRQFVLVDRPGSVQADIHIGRLAATRTDPDYYPLVVGNAILGGGASSRLFLDVREQKGLAYDAHSELDRRKDTGVFTAITQVRNEEVGTGVEAVLDNLSQMARAPVSESELTDVKNYISGGFLISLETQASLTDQIDLVNTMGLPRDYLEMFTSRVRSVEPGQIQAVARKYMDPAQSTIVVVGDAAQIAQSLEKFGPVQVEKAK